MRLGRVNLLSVKWAAIAVLAVLIHAPLAAQVWIQATTTGPGARTFHSLAYDSQRARTVLFGGTPSGSVFGDTWEWDGISWSQVAASGPLSRH